MSRQEREVKVKLQEDEISDLINSITSRAQYKGSIQQRDEYYDTDDLYITNLNRGLRIRFQEGSPYTLEFKSLFFNPNNTFNHWFIEEITMPLPLDEESQQTLNSILKRLKLATIQFKNDSTNYTQLKSILSSIGLQPVIEVDKRREVYGIKDSVITLDYVKDLGVFLEIESDNSDPRNILEELMEDKKFSIVQIGYNDLIAKDMLGYIPNDEKQKRFSQNPNWNVLETEKEVIQELFLSK